MTKKPSLAWKPMQDNWVLNGTGFFVSYNPNTAAGRMGEIFTGLVNALSPKINAKDGEETALHDDVNGTWYILEGDFCKEYEEVFEKGFAACLAVYEKNKKDHRSSWSTDDV